MFVKRLFSTLVLLGLLTAAVFAPSPWNRMVFLLLSSLLTFGLVREICDMVEKLNMETWKNLTAAFCSLVIAILNIGFLYPEMIVFAGYFFVFFLALSGPLFILFSKNSGEKIRKLFNSMGIGIFVMIPVLFILGIYATGLGFTDLKKPCNYYFLVFILLTKIGDIGAYVVGTVTHKWMKNGNHKMIPSISPGKSWEGAAGGLTVTVLLALGFHCCLPDLLVVKTVPLAVAAGVCLFFGSMAGDLMESALKRAAGVKDSGTTIPGIGGVFDLVDSLFVTAPVASAFFILAVIWC